jgi:hypothetical protein
VTTEQWITRIDAARREDEWLRRGEWHGYTNPGGSGAPMKGLYYLVRWASPTIAISHDEPANVLALARLVEQALIARDEDDPMIESSGYGTDEYLRSIL